MPLLCGKKTSMMAQMSTRSRCRLDWCNVLPKIKLLLHVIMKLYNNVLPKIKLLLHVIMKLFNNSTIQILLYVTTYTVDVLIKPNTDTDRPT